MVCMVKSQTVKIQVIRWYDDIPRLKRSNTKENLINNWLPTRRIYWLTEYTPYIFIGPESDHCSPLSLTHSLTNWLTHSCLVNLIDVTLMCEHANSRLVEVVTVAYVDAEDHVGNSLLIWELTFGHKTNLLFRLWAQGLVKILKLEFVQHFAADVL